MHVRMNELSRLVCFFTVGAAVVASSVAAEPAARFTAKSKQVEITPAARGAGKSSNAFAFDLYQLLRQQDGNLFFSPASVSTALAMVYTGARGETAEQMARALHLEGGRESATAGFGVLNAVLNNGGAGYQLSMANRLWGQKSYPLRPEFLAITREQFGAELAPLDFGKSEQARLTINRWVEERTNDKISDLIAPGVLDAMTRLVLTNAIYFKGGWEHEFSDKATKDAPFHLSTTKEVQAPLMHQSHEFAYAETGDFQLVALPYRGYDLSMLVLLPRRVEGLDQVEGQLTAENLNRWTSKLKDRMVHLSLAKFNMTSQFELSELLRELGMTLAFSDQADLSGISSAEGLKISDVIHKAYVDVSEKGTEAAAATAIVLAPTAAPIAEPEKPVVFRADHPFLFMIRDHRTGAILFLGRLTDPRQMVQ